MRVVLETSDLLEILGTHLGRTINSDQVVVRTDPVLEIEIEGAVGVSDVQVRRPTVVEDAAFSPQITREQAEPPRVRAQVTVEDSGMSLNDLLEYSRQIEDGVRAYRGR